MRKFILSAALGLAALAALPFVDGGSDAQAQRRGRGGVGVYWGNGGAYWGTGYGGYYGRPYYGSNYYGRPSGYYSSNYYEPSYTYSDDGRYRYYWDGGYYACYDRQTGKYFYQASDGRWWRYNY